MVDPFEDDCFDLDMEIGGMNLLEAEEWLEHHEPE